MTTLALVMLLGAVIGTVWDLCDPSAQTTTYYSTPRLLLAVTVAIGSVIALMMVVGLTGWQIAAAIASWLLVVAVSA